MTDLMSRLSAGRFRLRRLFLHDRDKLVQVKSWVPSIAIVQTYRGRRLEVCWPTMLIESYGQRMTVTPVWSRFRFALIWEADRG